MTQQQYDKLSKDCYLKYSLTDRCIQETVNAKTLLCTARFDIYGILFYIDQKVKGVRDLSYAKRIYKERTSAITGNRFSENGSETKNTFDDFVSVLDNLIADFQDGKFDIERTLIPVDKDNIPMDGAHRVACAAYFNQPINILRFPDREYQFKGYQYLKHELLPPAISDVMALEAAKWHDDLYVFYLWPKAHSYAQKIVEAQKLIYQSTDVMYEVEYKLTSLAIRNLMLQIYGHMDWIGTIESGFSNLWAKVNEVWNENGKVRLIITRSQSSSQILQLKSSIRGMFGIGLSSCHTTDNIRETRIALSALLNPESRHFLLRANPIKFKNSYKLFERFRKLITENDLDINRFVVDSSMVLALYGAREAQDLDFFSSPDTDISVFQVETSIEEHDDSQKKFYELPTTDYINNPEYHFVFNEVKVLSLPTLLKFKQKRYAESKQPKDAQDIALINKYLSNLNRFETWFSTLKYRYLRRQRICYDYVYALIFWRRREILEKVGLYKPLKALKTFVGK